MNKLKKITVYVLVLLFTVFTLIQALPSINADTQTGFILASAGRDGEFGTNDDITATDLEPVAAKEPANISLTEAVPSAGEGRGVVPEEGNTEPRPLRQPNSDEIPIYTAEELSKIGVDPGYPLNGKYIQMADIDLSGYGNWVPIGNNTKPFTGQFDGNGFVIKNLTINRPNSDYQGLFGYTKNTAKLTNVNLENVNIIGRFDTGGLVGWNEGTITNSYSMGNIIGNGSHVGGLVGTNCNSGTISNSYSTGSVQGNSYYTGGLAGSNIGGSISNSYSTCNVTGNNSTGGLVGISYNGTIKNSYSTGSVTGNSSTGGLVGHVWVDGIIVNSYSTGKVTGGDYTGGLVGASYGTITDSYSTGSVTGNNYTGGLAGGNYYTITNSYSTGEVKGNSYIGGLIGYNNSGAVINSSYWNTQTSNLSISAGGIGKTTAQMKTKSTFVGWDFTNIWAIDEGKSYPYLRTNEQVPHPGTN